MASDTRDRDEVEGADTNPSSLTFSKPWISLRDVVNESVPIFTEVASSPQKRRSQL